MLVAAVQQLGVEKENKKSIAAWKSEILKTKLPAGIKAISAPRIPDAPSFAARSLHRYGDNTTTTKGREMLDKAACMFLISHCPAMR